jgi:peptidoglycan/xylan/chitin deacetylase (PgdA/CDA1 family)
MSNKLTIAMYHYVRDLENSRYPQIKGLDYKLFKDQIAYFKNNFNVVTMEDVIEAYENKNQGILPENALLLTFDDGYIDHYQFAFPVLKENGVQGSFFIPGKTFAENTLLDVNKIHFILASANIDHLLEDVYKLLDYYRGNEFNIPFNEELFSKYAEANRFDSKEVIFVKRILQTVLPERLRNIITSNIFEKYVGLPEEKFSRELYMNREQIKLMKDSGMFIGIHGYDHYWLGNLEKEQIQQDISKALDTMDEFIDRKSWVMNYPYGSWSDDVVDYISKNGCKLGLTTDVRIADIRMDNPYKIPRLDTNDFPPKSSNYKKY